MGLWHLVQADLIVLFGVQALYELAQRRHYVYPAGRAGPGRRSGLTAGATASLCRGCGALLADRARPAWRWRGAGGVLCPGRWKPPPITRSGRGAPRGGGRICACCMGCPGARQAGHLASRAARTAPRLLQMQQAMSIAGHAPREGEEILFPPSFTKGY